MKKEPAVIVSLAAALLGLAALFGLDLSQEQTAAILAVVTVVAGLIIRGQVTPTKNASNQSGGTWGLLTEAAVDRNAPHGENPELIDDGDVR